MRIVCVIRYDRLLDVCDLMFTITQCLTNSDPNSNLTVVILKSSFQADGHGVFFHLQ